MVGTAPSCQSSEKIIYMNPELLNQAVIKVGNAKTLINLVSRRVRQLNAGGGSLSRPLIADVGTLGIADIALREILEEKIGWDMPEFVESTKTSVKRRKKATAHPVAAAA